MGERFYSTLGLCMRAGKLSFGLDTVTEAVKAGKVCLLMTASDLSEKTCKEVVFLASKYQIPYLALDRTQSQLRSTIGKLTGVLAITDAGLARSLQASAND